MKKKEISEEEQESSRNIITLALAGQPNVGKSVIFNLLTGLSQVIGNWPGKTVKKAEGSCKFKNYDFKIIDLPGIYSFSTFSLEEIISREYILEEKPDYVVNVIDSNHLERNLYFTLQLLMLNQPVILSMNQIDILKEQGYKIDIKKLENLLGIPVIPAIAVHNRGVHEILEKIIEIEEKKIHIQPKPIIFGKEIESKIIKIENEVIEKCPNKNIPSKFMAMKLLEKDNPSINQLKKNGSGSVENLLYKIEETRKNLEEIHGEQITTIINAELYLISSNISKKVLSIGEQSKKNKLRHKIDHLTLDNKTGYLIFALIMFGVYFSIFKFGDLISGLFDLLFNFMTPTAISLLHGQDSFIYKVVWNGIVGGFFAGLGGVLPYVIPFFMIIEILQDIGYLPRAAYLMDRLLHTLGVHGKTIIPILIGFGCNVPAVSAAMIMETEKQKRRAIVIASMVPCSAVTTIVLGLVGKYLGIGWAFFLYIFNFGVIILTAKLMGKIEGDKKTKESELIIELHDFRKPNFKVIAKQTWHRSKEFIVLALPLIIVLGILLQIMIEIEILDPINKILSPITVFALGLPIGVGVYLFYGVLRKELNLVLLNLYVASLLPAVAMNEYMTPIQMIIFTLVTMLYVPCLATIIVIKKETNWKFALQIFAYQIGIAILIGSIINWGSQLLNLIFQV